MTEHHFDRGNTWQDGRLGTIGPRITAPLVCQPGMMVWRHAEGHQLMDDGLAPLPPKLHFSIDQFGLLTLGNGERRGTAMPLVVQPAIKKTSCRVTA